MSPAVAALLFQLLAPSRPPVHAEPADSARVHRSARSAQAEFENERRRRLPHAWGGSGGRCDVRVGRFCYWHDDGESRGPEEPRTIAPFRAALAERLAEAALLVPGDGWIAGQRVRYLVEAGQFTEALAAAGECRAERWWCTALAGFVSHVAGSHAEADSTFAAALEAMPHERRCAWEDASGLLPPRAARAYARLSCAERRAWLAPVWRLADPSWSRPGNDRRTEHYARQVMSQLEREARSTYSMPWGKDTHELVVRFGWPERWSRSAASGIDPTAYTVIGHEPHPAFEFFPDDSAIFAPGHLEEARWDFRAREARSRYAPPYARSMQRLESQVTRFYRGDSVLVIAALTVPRDTAFGVGSLHAAVAVDTGAGLPPVVSPLGLGNGRGLARLTFSADSALVGVELSDSTHRSMAVARRGISAGDRSDLGLLLYADPRAADATLDDVIGRALGSHRVSRHERLGLYWEYEAEGSAGDSVTYVLTVYPRSASWLTRLARTMRLAEAAAPVHMRFTEPRGPEHHSARALGIDLSHLPSGTYDVRVRVELGEREVGRATRTLVLRDR